MMPYALSELTRRMGNTHTTVCNIDKREACPGDRLPPEIVEVTRILLEAARTEPTFQEQID